MNPEETLWGWFWPGLSTDYIFPHHLPLPGDWDNSVGLQESVSAQTPCLTVFRVFGCFPFPRAQCSSLCGRTWGITTGYTCGGAALSLVQSWLHLHSVGSRSENAQGIMALYCGNCLQKSLISFDSRNWAVLLLVAFLFSLPPSTHHSINHICNSLQITGPLTLLLTTVITSSWLPTMKHHVVILPLLFQCSVVPIVQF